jgi:hypothetical protein
MSRIDLSDGEGSDRPSWIRKQTESPFSGRIPSKNPGNGSPFCAGVILIDTRLYDWANEPERVRVAGL